MQVFIAGCHTDVGKTHVSSAICALFGYDYFKLLQAGEMQDRDFVYDIVRNCSIFEVKKLDYFENSKNANFLDSILDSKDLQNLDSTFRDSINSNFANDNLQNLDSINSNIHNFNIDKIQNLDSKTANFNAKKLQNIESNIHIFPNGITLKTACSPHIAKMRENIEYDGLNIKIPDSKNLVIELAGGLFSPLDSKICMIDYIMQNGRDVILVGGYYLGSINHILQSYESLNLRNINILKLVMFGDKNKEIDNFIESYLNIKIVNLPYFTKQNFKEKTFKFQKELMNIF